MKYAIIFYIALGIVLSQVIGITYSCEGHERLPDYYGSPFIFKQRSLASSMEYFYSVSGLILNTMLWSVVPFLIHVSIQRHLQQSHTSIKAFYTVLIVVMILFSTVIIRIETTMIGEGFNKDLNYWYWNVDKEAEAWGVHCRSELVIFYNWTGK